MSSARSVPLGEVTDFIRGITFKPADVVPFGAKGAVACMRTKNVQTVLDCEDLLAVPRALVKRRDQFLREGDVLVSSANSWNLVGKCSWVPALDFESTFGGFVSVLRTKSREDLDPRYLYWWFSSPPIQTLARSFGQQTTNISNLNVDRCRQLPIPRPPMVQQRRIAAILDQADALRTKWREAIAEIEKLTQSIFSEMFGDAATNSKHLSVARIGDIGDVQGGLQLSGARSSLPIEVPYLRVANVYRDRLDLAEVKTFRATQAELARTLLVRDDVLIVEGHGNPEEIGRCALWDGSIEPCSHQNHLIRVRVDASKADPVFVSRFLNSPGGRKGLTSASNTTSGLNTISVGKVRECRLLLPPIEQQRLFADRVRSVGRMHAKQTKAAAFLDRLFASLQHRAFRGEL